MSSKRSVVFRGIAAIMAFLMAISMSLATLVFQYDAWLNSNIFGIDTSYVVGGNDGAIYYANSYGYDDSALVNVNIDAANFNVELAGESIVLLKNENSALPLSSDDQITIFGNGAVDTVIYKSTAPDYLDYVSFVGAMQDTFGTDNVNITLCDNVYSQMSTTTTSSVAEAPIEEVTAYESSWQSGYNDAAVVVFSRTGSEGNDLYMYAADDTYEDGSARRMLDLSSNEEALIRYLSEQKAAGVFSKIVVILASDYALELGFLEEYDVDACILAGNLGSFGCTALGQILVGEVNPSGHTADTYAANSLSAPAVTYSTVENTQQWTNSDEVMERNPLVNDNNGGTIINYVIYAEGIYVGYKYYETRYEDVVMGAGNAASSVGSTDGESWSYTDEVVYPFGYGLSYTTFTQTLDSVAYDEESDAYLLMVTVANTGTTAGKDVVEVYAQTPYGDYERANLVEKASVSLVGYAKTAVIEPGASETVTVEVPRYFLASYDANAAKTYILSQGSYYLAIGDDAHDALNNILAAKGYTIADGMDYDGDAAKTYAWEQAELDTETYSTSVYTDVEVTNLFDNADINYYGYDFTYLTRNDWEGTYPAEPVAYEATDAIIDSLSNFDYETPADAPSVDDFTQGADNGLTLDMLIGLEYDDPLWETFLDQMTVEQMANLITDNLSVTVVSELNIPGTSHIDDENMSGGQFNFISHAAQGRSWNIELAEERGYYMGLIAQLNGYDEIWAGASNFHRTQFNGRFSQYYSEDATLDYWTCYYEAKGMQSTGVIFCAKHSTCNDQETGRTGLSVFLTEQTLREIYMRAFEGALAHEDGAMSTMTSLGRIGTRLAKNNAAYLTDLLRGEWGFEGHVTSDGYVSTGYFQNTYEELVAGMDYSCIDTDGVNAERMIEGIEGGDGYLLQILRQSAHRNLYVMVHTARMNGLGEGGGTVVTVLPAWEAAVLFLNIGVIAAMVIFVVLSVVTYKKKKHTNTAA